jgi:hypothetical protein
MARFRRAASVFKVAESGASALYGEASALLDPMQIASEVKDASNTAFAANY